VPPALRELVNQLPRGSRLVCVFDCCYVTEKPAFRIHHSQRGGPVRVGVRVGVRGELLSISYMCPGPVASIWRALDPPSIPQELRGMGDRRGLPRTLSEGQPSRDSG